MSNICQSFLSAMRATASPAARKRFAGSAVLGDAFGYTVELADGEQIYVGRTHCKYCARVEALSKLSSQDERS